MECIIEQQVMNEYEYWMKQQIDKPIVASQEIFKNKMLVPLGINCTGSGENFDVQRNQNQELHERLRKLLNAHAQLSGWVSEGSISFRQIRLTDRDLQWAIDESAKMLAKHYPEHVIKWTLTSEEVFWNKRGLAYRDWIGLAKQLIVKEFGAELLTPLEEDDRRFELKVRHTGVKDYMDQLLSGSHREDLDDVTPEMNTKHQIHIHLPPINASYYATNKLMRLPSTLSEIGMDPGITEMPQLPGSDGVALYSFYQNDSQMKGEVVVVLDTNRIETLISLLMSNGHLLRGVQ